MGFIHGMNDHETSWPEKWYTDKYLENLVSECKKDWIQAMESVGGDGWNIQPYLDDVARYGHYASSKAWPFPKRDGYDWEHYPSMEIRDLENQYQLQSSQFAKWLEKAGSLRAPKRAVLALLDKTSYKSYQLTNAYLIYMAKKVIYDRENGIRRPADMYPNGSYDGNRLLANTLFFAYMPTPKQHKWAILSTVDEISK